MQIFVGVIFIPESKKTGLARLVVMAFDWRFEIVVTIPYMAKLSWLE